MPRLERGFGRPPMRLWIVLGGLIAASAYVRLPGFIQGGFASHDVAGILYNAMLLHAGDLPYVESVELKPPGTFYLATALAGVDGSDIAQFQVWANLWALASTIAVATLGIRLWGIRSAVVATGLYVLHDAYLDSMDANYVTWAQLPLVLTCAWALAADVTAHPRARTLGFGVAGALAGVAVLCKQPAGIGMMFVCALALTDGRRPWPQRAHDLLVATGGFALAHAPIVAHYGAAGHLDALWEGYVRNRWGFEYAAFGARNLALTAPREGLLATAHFVGAPLALAAFAFVPPRAATPAARRTSALLMLWAGLALLAASIGFRFYKGYFLATLPPLCLLAAAPWGLFGRARELSWWARALALAALSLLLLRAGAALYRERVNRSIPHDRGGRIIAAHIDASAPPAERIWVWGWHLWDVYALSGRLSATRFYKSIGLITSANDATWRVERSPMHFVDEPAAAALVAELRENLPCYIVTGSTVPVAEFAALRQLLRDHYVRDRRVRLGRVQFWRRRS